MVERVDLNALQPLEVKRFHPGLGQANLLLPSRASAVAEALAGQELAPTNPVSTSGGVSEQRTQFQADLVVELGDLLLW